MIPSFTWASSPVFTEWPMMCYCWSGTVSPTTTTSFRIQGPGSSKHCPVQLLPVSNGPLHNWCFTEHLRGRLSFTPLLCFYQRRHQIPFLWKPRRICSFLHDVLFLPRYKTHSILESPNKPICKTWSRIIEHFELEISNFLSWKGSNMDPWVQFLVLHRTQSQESHHVPEISAQNKPPSWKAYMPHTKEEGRGSKAIHVWPMYKVSPVCDVAATSPWILKSCHCVYTSPPCFQGFLPFLHAILGTSL